MKTLRRKQVNNLAIDEMRSYIGNKDNDFWLWTVVVHRRKTKAYAKTVNSMKRALALALLFVYWKFLSMDL